MTTEAFAHAPVMLDEIVELFATVPSGPIVDATLGGAGHSSALLAAHDHVSIIGFDQDPMALAAAEARLAEFGPRAQTVKARFDALAEQLEGLGVEDLSGALFDLGVSSPQLDQGERGFSYQHDGPIDMRMDTSQTWSAADVVNGYEERELAQLITRYSDERFARRIAKAIVARRPIETTAELAEIVVSAIPAPARRKGGHPAKRTFQALRIEVNDELGVLPDAIDQALAATAPGGRVAVLSYHSGEHRIVKQRFAAARGRCVCPTELPCVCGALQTVRPVRTAKTPTAEESARNRRAASAQLRVVERIAPTPVRPDPTRPHSANPTPSTGDGPVTEEVR